MSLGRFLRKSRNLAHPTRHPSCLESVFPAVLFHVLLLFLYSSYFREQNPLLTTCPKSGDHLISSPLRINLLLSLRKNLRTHEGRTRFNAPKAQQVFLQRLPKA